jgi:hypothetical protein
MFHWFILKEKLPPTDLHLDDRKGSNNGIRARSGVWIQLGNKKESRRKERPISIGSEILKP